MFKNVKAQVEKQNDLIARAETIVNSAEVENRELTEAEAAELAEIRDDVKKIKEYLQIVDDIDGARTSAPAAEESAGEERALDEEAELEERAFENFIRGHVVHERASELAKDNNGAIIPKTIAKRIIEQVYDICPVLERSDRYNTKGTLELPYYPANGSGDITVAYATEFQALTSSTGNFGTIELSDFLAGALTKISESLINNTDIDIVAFIVKRMAASIAGFIEKEILIGTANKVEGFRGITNTKTAASATAITANDLIELQGKVKDVYQANAIWIMNSATRTAIRRLRDDEGHLLMTDDFSAPFGRTLLGRPVFVSDNMPNIAASAKPIYYGDMSGVATKFSENISVKVLRELFATEHAVGVVGWVEFDAKISNQQKVAALVMAAS